MEEYIENGYDTPGLEAAVDRALPFIEMIEAKFLAKVDSAEKVVSDSTDALKQVQSELKRLGDMKQDIQGGKSSRGRARTKTTKTMGDSEDQLEIILNKIVETRCKQKDLKLAEKESKDAAASVIKTHNEWKTEFPWRNKESLMQYGKKVLEPVGEYYKQQFLDASGDCHPIREMAEAVQIFNPIFLSTQSTADIVTVLYDLANKLNAFQFRQFNDRFFDNLRKETVNVVREAKEDHDLDRIPATRRYETRMQGKVKRKQLPAGSNMEWRDDAGEYAQRIWQWWKARKDNYPFHGLAIRLVVLAQLSSCSVERVFSKLERIRKATGENMKEDMCEIRLLLQCNGTLDDMYDALVLKWKGD